jgi:hypothetical protein
MESKREQREETPCTGGQQPWEKPWVDVGNIKKKHFP